MNDTYFAALSEARDLFARMDDPDAVARLHVQAQREYRGINPDTADGAYLEAQIAAAEDRLWELRHGHLTQRAA